MLMYTIMGDGHGALSNQNYYNDGKPGVAFTPSTWVCLEALIDHATPEIDVWVDGIEVPDLHHTDWPLDSYDSSASASRSTPAPASTSGTTTSRSAPSASAATRRVRRAPAAALLSLLPPGRRRQRADVLGPRGRAEAPRLGRRGADQQPLWRDPHARLPAEESWDGIRIHRVFRPPWDQARPLERLANSGWLTVAWLLRTLRLGRFDAIVIGSDPAFSPLLALALRLAYPSAAIVHWCFDLYPEAIAAEGSSAAAQRWPGRAPADGTGLPALRRARRHRPAHARAARATTAAARAARRWSPGR